MAIGLYGGTDGYIMAMLEVFKRNQISKCIKERNHELQLYGLLSTSKNDHIEFLTFK